MHVKYIRNRNNNDGHDDPRSLDYYLRFTADLKDFCVHFLSLNAINQFRATE